MKLQAKINVRFLVLMILIFSVAGVVFYYMIGEVANRNIREMLESRRAYIILNLQKGSSLTDSFASPDNSIFIRHIDEPMKYRFYSDTLAYDQAEKELIPFRKLTFTVSSGDHNYKVVLLQSLLEMEDFRMLIFTFLGGLFLFVMTSLFLVNSWLSSKAWKPFLKSLSVLNSWKFSEKKSVHFDTTGISEFDQLNDMLQNMMQKIRTDFVSLKEFTENASHELQTPLAIIKSKLELILQDKSLIDAQRRQMQSAFESTIRLSKLNESLLLLAKIENQQFVGSQEIDFCQLIQTRIEYLSELFELKKIEVRVQIDRLVLFNMNPLLAEILINNLLSNALRHNHENGRLFIHAGYQEITISNTGLNQELDASGLFRRFAKQTSTGDSNGLGLSIASEICKASNIGMSYHYSDDMHHFVLKQES
jgi:signal transduction histidine kinase